MMANYHQRTVCLLEPDSDERLKISSFTKATIEGDDSSDTSDDFVIEHQKKQFRLFESDDEHLKESPPRKACKMCAQLVPATIYAAHRAACLRELVEDSSVLHDELSNPETPEALSDTIQDPDSSDYCDVSDEAAEHSDDNKYYLRGTVERVLTDEEVVLAGLERGDELPFDIVEMGGEKGRGVIAKEDIAAKQFLCEYKTARTYHPRFASKYEQEYAANNEGSYILTCPSNPRMCFDATRRPIQIGRFINHAPGTKANCRPLHPLMVRGKFRVGFISTRIIKAGEEVLYDYRVRTEEWMKSKPSTTHGTSGSSRKRNAESPHDSEDLLLKEGTRISEAPPCKRSRLTSGKSKAVKTAKRRYKICPVEGCQAPAVKKLSNHLGQFHGIVGDRRRELLRKAKGATQSQLHSRTPAAMQGTLSALWAKGGEGTSQTFNSRVPESPNPSTSPPSTSSPPLPPLGRTQAFGRFSLEDGFLKRFSNHLLTTAGGKKSLSLSKEIATDVSKFLYHANPQLNPRLLLKRSAIANYCRKLEEAGIQASGRQTKLRRLLYALDYLLLEEEDAEDEADLLHHADATRNFVKTMCSRMSTERTRQEKDRNVDFTPPSLDGVSEFLASGQLTASSSLLHKEVKEGKAVSSSRLMTEMISVMGRIAYSNAQRPGPVLNVMMTEYRAREVRQLDGRNITSIKVHNHKTAAQGTAVLHLEEDLSHQLDEWVETLRPQVVPPTCPLVFATTQGNTVNHFSEKVVSVGKKLGFSLPKLTDVRKAVVTKAAQSVDATTREALAEQMSHSVATAERFYNQKKRCEQKVKGYKVSSAIVRGEEPQEAKGGRSRKGFSEVEEDLITTYFDEYIQLNKAPPVERVREFLSCHTMAFTSRNPKDIIDKVRTIIRRKKKGSSEH